MANFCKKCGSPLTNDLCPNCDTATKPTPNFCKACGSPIDKTTGKCPHCEPAVNNAINLSDSQGTPSVPVVKKQRSKGAKAAITIVLSILLFITSIGWITILSVRNITSEKGLEKVLNKVEVSDVLDIIDDSSDADTEKILKDLNEYSEELQEKDYYRYEDYAPRTISKRDLKNFLEKSSLKSFIAENAATFMNDIYTGDNDFSLSTEDIAEFLVDNEREIENELGLPADHEVVYELANWIADDDELEDLTAADFKNSAPAIYYAIQYSFSYITMAIFMLISAAIIVFMLWNSVSGGLNGISACFITWGGMFTIISLLALITPLWNGICGNSVISLASSRILVVNLAITLPILLVGILVLTGKILFNKFVKKQ